MNRYRGWQGILVAMQCSLVCAALGQGGKEDPAPQGSQGLHWYRCNTHTHTATGVESDVDGSLEFAAEWYRSHGYQCLVITNHEVLSDVAPLNQKYGADFLVIPGQEITQSVYDAAVPDHFRSVHMNGININTAIMPLGYPKEDLPHVTPAEAYLRNFAAVKNAGGIPQVNHPNLFWSVRLEDLLPIPSPYLLEVSNSFPTSNNLGAVDDNGKKLPSTEALWDGLLSRGKIVWAVASDDTHEYKKFDFRDEPTPGKGWIVVQANALSVADITEALRKGSFYASTGVTLTSYSVGGKGIAIQIAPQQDWNTAMKSSTRYLTRFVGANGRVLSEVAGISPHYDFHGDEQYVRASIVDSDGRRAWTQPVFRDGREKAR